MAKTGKLTAREVETAKRGMRGDGGGLWLQTRGPTAKAWLFRYSWEGKAKTMGLGPVAIVSLAEARDLAEEARRQLRQGIDPIEARKGQKEAREAEKAQAMAFRDVAKACYESRGAGWRSKKHTSQWWAALEGYVLPVLGDKPIASIEVDDVLRVLTPVWTNLTVTANRLRSRIETVIDYAIAKKMRTTANPAKWSVLKHILPAPTKVKQVKHFNTIPHADIPELIAKLAHKDTVPSLALQFCILTCARSNEVLAARRAEFDLENALWTVPTERLKRAKHPHRVPLSAPALAIAKRLLAEHEGEFVFGASPGPDGKNRPRNHAVMLGVLHEYVDSATVHGVARAGFRSWAADNGIDRELAERALGHAIGDAAEQSYMRSDLLERRRAVAERWGSHCMGRANGSNVVRLA